MDDVLKILQNGKHRNDCQLTVNTVFAKINKILIVWIIDFKMCIPKAFAIYVLRDGFQSTTWFLLFLNNLTPFES